MKNKRTGRCLCGKCKYNFQSDKIEAGVCHCSMCRKWSGGVTMGVHIDGPLNFENEDHVKWYESSQWGMRGFCSECGTNLAWATKDRSMMVPFAGSLDESSDVVFKEEIFIDEKPEFYHFGNDTKQKTGAEVFAEYSGE